MKSRRLNRFSKTVLSGLVLIALLAFSSSSVFASAGNTIVRNTVTVNYDDAAGNGQAPITSTIDVTVNTVDSAALVLSFDPDPGTTNATDDIDTYTVTFVTTSNGPGTTTWGGSDNNASNITLSGTDAAFAIGTAFLGATYLDPTEGTLGSSTTINDGNTITFAVPNDGGLPTDGNTSGGSIIDGILNGITSGDIVYLLDENGASTYGPFTVGTVTDPAFDTGTIAAPGSIDLQNLTGADITVTPVLGWSIVEATTDTMTVTQGVIADTALAASWDTTVTTTMGGSSDPTAGTVTTNAVETNLSVEKEVFDGTNWQSSNVTADPGATLTYRITVTNNGTGEAGAVVITDPTPEYTTYAAGTAKSSVILDADYGDGTNTPLTDADAADDGYDYNVTTGNTSTYSVGTVAAGDSVLLFFQVTID